MNRSNQQPRLTSRLALMAAAGALGACLCAPGQAAQATASASGTVVAPIAIAVNANLVFGNFAAGTGGTVTVSTSGVRAASGPVLMAAVAASAARFDVTGAASTTYAITHGGTAVLTNTTGTGGETMALAKFSDLTGANATAGNVGTGALDGTGAQSLYVGGTLSVAAAQVPGLYTGTVIATVEYN
jgi:hypothetical protein